MQPSPRPDTRDSDQRIERASLQELRIRRASPIPDARDPYNELKKHMLQLISDNISADLKQCDTAAARKAVQAELDPLLAQEKIILKRHEKRQLIQDIIAELLAPRSPFHLTDTGNQPMLSYTIEELCELALLTRETAEFLQKKILAKSTIVISGQAQTGKTILLRALCDLIPAEEHIAIIEEQRELHLERENLISLQTKASSQPPRPAISTEKLIMMTAPMRPDRLILGVLHDAAIATWVQAINAGSWASMTTCCAESPQELLERMEAMLTLADPATSVRSARQQIGSAIDIIVQLARSADNLVRIDSITEISTGKDKPFVTVDLL